MDAILSLRILIATMEPYLCAQSRTRKPVQNAEQSSYEHIVDLAEQLLERNGSKRSRLSYPKYSFSPVIDQILAYVGICCRNGIIRRKVITLLRKWPDRDGIWDNKVTASLVEIIMTLEEEAWSQQKFTTPDWCHCVVGSFICNTHRVCDHSAEFLSNNRVKIIVRTTNDIILNHAGRIVELPC